MVEWPVKGPTSSFCVSCGLEEVTPSKHQAIALRNNGPKAAELCQTRTHLRNTLTIWGTSGNGVAQMRMSGFLQQLRKNNSISMFRVPCGNISRTYNRHAHTQQSQLKALFCFKLQSDLNKLVPNDTINQYWQVCAGRVRQTSIKDWVKDLQICYQSLGTLWKPWARVRKDESLSCVSKSLTASSNNFCFLYSCCMRLFKHKIGEPSKRKEMWPIQVCLGFMQSRASSKIGLEWIR